MPRALRLSTTAPLEHEDTYLYEKTSKDPLTARLGFLLSQLERPIGLGPTLLLCHHIVCCFLPMVNHHLK